MSKSKKSVERHSSYWMNDDIWGDQDDVVSSASTKADQKSKMARLFRLSAARRATANFVNILTNRNDIQVVFSTTKDSFTDGKTIVISADDKPENFDSIVGLALHEAAHVLLSDFSFIRRIYHIRNSLQRNPTGYDYIWMDELTGGVLTGLPNTPRIDVRHVIGAVGPTVMKNILHPVIARTLPPLFADAKEYVEAAGRGDVLYHQAVSAHIDNIKTIMNVLEDRRIDAYVYRTAGGYRPYYDALYNRYVFTDEVAKNLRWNPDWRTITVENYINRLILMFHPNADPNALPGLDKLYRMVDLPNIDRFDSNSTDWKASVAFSNMPKLWVEANKIYARILRYASLAINPDESMGAGMPTGQQMIDAVEGTDQSEDGLDGVSANDMIRQDIEDADTTKTGKPKPRNFNAKTGKTAMDTIRDLVDGQMKKKKATRQEVEAAQAIEDASAQMVNIGGDGIPDAECIVTRKMTSRMLSQEWFIFGTNYKTRSLENAILAGKRMGRILEQRLQVRNDPVTTKSTRLNSGAIDRRLLAQLGMDITQIFQKSRIDGYKPAMLHLTIDASGSMSGNKWYKVVQVATALAYIGSKIRNIDTVISIRGGENVPIVSILYDSRKNPFADFVKWIGHVSPRGATPEGLCFKATMNLILENTATHDVYFINFSDGEPSFYLNSHSVISKAAKSVRGIDCRYYGDIATKHTLQQVKTMREHGVKILSYFISEYTNQPNTYNSSNGSWSTFRSMYGEDAAWVNVENAGDVLKTLNKVLTKKI